MGQSCSSSSKRGPAVIEQVVCNKNKQMARIFDTEIELYSSNENRIIKAEEIASSLLAKNTFPVCVIMIDRFDRDAENNENPNNKIMLQIWCIAIKIALIKITAETLLKQS